MADKTLKNTLDESKKHPRITFFLGAAMALGWELGYDDLHTLGTHTRSLVECFDVLEAMKRARADGRVAAGLRAVSDRFERDAIEAMKRARAAGHTAARFGK